MTVHENSHNIIDLHQAYSDVTESLLDRKPLRPNGGTPCHCFH